MVRRKRNILSGIGIGLIVMSSIVGYPYVMDAFGAVQSSVVYETPTIMPLFPSLTPTVVPQSPTVLAEEVIEVGGEVVTASNTIPTPIHQESVITSTSTPPSQVPLVKNTDSGEDAIVFDGRSEREQLLDPELTLPTPTPTPIIYPESAYPTRLVIPAIDLDAPVVGVGLQWQTVRGKSQLSWEAPDLFAVGWHLDSVPLGYDSNTVLNGHNNILGGVFRKLKKVNPGDEVIVYAGTVPYYFRVTQQHILRESGQSLEVRVQNAKWVQHTVDERLTMVTCWPVTSNTHRLIVVAEPFVPTPTPIPDLD